jgi:hypothetical protein
MMMTRLMTRMNVVCVTGIEGVNRNRFTALMKASDRAPPWFGIWSLRIGRGMKSPSWLDPLVVLEEAKT